MLALQLVARVRLVIGRSRQRSRPRNSNLCARPTPPERRDWGRAARPDPRRSSAPSIPNARQDANPQRQRSRSRDRRRPRVRAPRRRAPAPCVTRTTSMPAGGSSSVGPSSNVTRPPRNAASRASAIPVAPVDALLRKRTGSNGSRVGPPVIATRFPCSELRRASARPNASRMRSSPAKRPTPRFALGEKSALRVDDLVARARAVAIGSLASQDPRTSPRSSPARAGAEFARRAARS